MLGAAFGFITDGGGVWNLASSLATVMLLSEGVAHWLRFVVSKEIWYWKKASPGMAPVRVWFPNCKYSAL